MAHGRKPAARKAAARPLSLVGAVFKLLWRMGLFLVFLVAVYKLLPYLIVLAAIPVLLFFTGAVTKAAFASRRD
jgi:hypothetical protein